ncbi:MAG: hypothetical protein ABIS59_02605 [Candidatus Saccharibacteria bacterium]
MKRIIILIAILGFAYAGISARAHNRSLSIAKANAIVNADQVGEPTAPLLASLKNFVKTHTGSSVKLTLGGSYARAQTSAQDSTKSQEITGQLYAEGQATCASKADSLVQARCVQAYVTARLKALSIPAAATPPNPNDYIISYVAPSLAADTATAMGLLSLLSLIGGFFWILPKKKHI